MKVCSNWQQHSAQIQLCRLCTWIVTPLVWRGPSFSMSNMLQHNTSLEDLFLCNESVGEEGVCHLIDTLKHNQTLDRLWLPKKYLSETSDQRVFWLWWQCSNLENQAMKKTYAGIYIPAGLSSDRIASLFVFCVRRPSPPSFCWFVCLFLWFVFFFILHTLRRPSLLSIF